MNHKLELISYMLATMASLCFVSGLLVLKGGEPHHGKLKLTYIHD